MKKAQDGQTHKATQCVPNAPQRVAPRQTHAPNIYNTKADIVERRRSRASSRQSDAHQVDNSEHDLRPHRTTQHTKRHRDSTIVQVNLGKVFTTSKADRNSMKPSRWTDTDTTPRRNVCIKQVTGCKHTRSPSALLIPVSTWPMHYVQ